MTYTSLAGPEIDTSVQNYGETIIVNFADYLLENGEGEFGQYQDPARRYAFGNTSVIPELSADIFLLAHQLTGDGRYFEAMASDAGFGLGANPDNLTYTTGLGHLSPHEIVFVDAAANGSEPPPGITVFGGKTEMPDHQGGSIRTSKSCSVRSITTTCRCTRPFKMSPSPPRSANFRSETARSKQPWFGDIWQPSTTMVANRPIRRQTSPHPTTHLQTTRHRIHQTSRLILAIRSGTSSPLNRYKVRH